MRSKNDTFERGCYFTDLFGNRFGRFEYVIRIRDKLISAKKEYYCRVCRYNAWNFKCARSEKNEYNKCDLKDVCIKYHVER